MAPKALLFLLAFVLLVSTKVTSTAEDIIIIEQHHAKSPAQAPVKPPVYSPKKAPTYAPFKAPIYPPKKAPAYPPKVAPTYPPKKAPAYPPKISPIYYPPTHQNHGNCVPLCVEYCKNEKKSKRGCVRTCVPCCDQYKCVPGPYKKCTNWDKVMYHGQFIPCPKC